MAFGASQSYSPPAQAAKPSPAEAVAIEAGKQVATQEFAPKPAGQYLAQRHFINRTDAINAKAEGDQDAADAEFNDELTSFKRLGKDVTPVDGVTVKPKKRPNQSPVLLDYRLGRDEGA